MTSFLKTFLGDESGAAAAEYVLILAIVGAGVAGGAYILGTSVKKALTDTATKVDTCGGVAAANSTTC